MWAFLHHYQVCQCPYALKIVYSLKTFTIFAKTCIHNQKTIQFNLKTITQSEVLCLSLYRFWSLNFHSKYFVSLQRIKVEYLFQNCVNKKAVRKNFQRMPIAHSLHSAPSSPLFKLTSTLSVPFPGFFPKKYGSVKKTNNNTNSLGMAY